MKNALTPSTPLPPILTHQAALLRLAMHEEIIYGDLDAALPVVAQIVAETLDLDRVGVWFFSPDGERLECRILFAQGALQPPNRPQPVAKYARYFSVLRENRAINAPDARNDPRTREFRDEYLIPSGVYSLLDAAIRREGRTIGVICAEATDNIRHWSADEVHFMASVADLVAMIVERDHRLHAEQFLQKILETVPHIIYVFDLAANENIFISKRALGGLGYSDEEILKMGPQFMTKLLHPEDLQRIGGLLSRWRTATDQDLLMVEYRLRSASGVWCWFRGYDRVFKRGSDGRVLQLIGVAQDITDEKRAEVILRESEARYRTLFDAAGDALLVMHQGRITDCNIQALRLFRCARTAMVGRDIGDFLKSDGDCACNPEGLLADCRAPEASIWRGHREEGDAFDAEVSLSQMMLNGSPLQLAIVRDVTERNRHLVEMEYQATHDALTHLPNRKLLYEHTIDLIDRAKRGGHKVAMLLIDLDRFKEINDTLGHHSGDLLLKQIGPRLFSLLPSSDAMLARLGGDEFAIVLPRVEHSGEAVEKADALLRALRRPFDLLEMRVEIGGSAGVALYPDHGEGVSGLLRCADVAMYHAKKNSQGVSLYTAERDVYSLRRLSLITELGAAIREGQLLLFYQPMVNLKTRTLVGFEALLRWQHPRFGLTPPVQFIPLAEAGDMIRPLTQWVINKALEDLNNWQEAGFDVGISINLSSRNLLDEDCLQHIISSLAKYPRATQRLSIEITESALITDPEHAESLLGTLHHAGVNIAIDDFGTGYSSLVYLRRLPISALKIDLGFVKGMLHNQSDKIIVDAIIQLAHKLSLSVVAEGVEDQALFDELLEMGCDVAQGYHISRPIPADLIVAWLQNSPWIGST